MSNAPTVDLAGIQKPKRAEKYRFGGPLGYVVGASETFRTVSTKQLAREGVTFRPQKTVLRAASSIYHKISKTAASSRNTEARISR